MASGSNSRAIVLFLLTSGFLITGVLFDYMPLIVDDQIKQKIQLATNDQIRSFWSRPPVEFESYYWLYDILNPEQFMAGERVRVRKVGPYKFTSRVEKRVIELSANKYRIVYNSSRHYHLNETIGWPAANWNMDEPLTLLNPIYASMVTGAREFAGQMDQSLRATVPVSINRLADRFNETLLRNSSAREALMGRKIPLIGKAKKMAEAFGTGVNFPDTRPDNVFGFVVILNGTEVGPYEIYTGYEATMSSLGDIISYKGKRRSTEYTGRCNRLQASAGELRPMPIKRDQILEIFMPSFCRIAHLKPTGSQKVREGLAVSYVFAPEDFMSAEVNPDNRCFCVNGTSGNYCTLNGAIELGPCSHWSPIVIGMPHVDLDPHITDTIQNWDPQLVDSSIEFRPAANKTSQLLILQRLGVPVKADITMFIFMKVIRDAAYRQTSSVPEVSYVPILMVRETVTIPPKFAEIIVNLESFLALTYHIKVVMYLSSLVLLCWLTGQYYGRFNASHRGDRVQPSGDNGHRGGSGGPGATTGDNEILARGVTAAAISGAAFVNHRNDGGDSGSGLRGAPDQPTAGDSLSERANSADSNRSQPPSRRSSLGVSGESNDVPVVGADKQAQRLAEADQAAAEVARLASGAAMQSEQQVGRVAKFFSKVDELAQPAGKSADKTDKQPTGTAISGGGANKIANLEMDGRPLVDDKQTADGARADEKQRKGPVRMGSQHLGARSNWFMKVCSNFVRMLNGLRTTIGDAGQLNVSENDYQDRQLEMLAGKIDNWYNGQVEAATAGACDDTSEVTVIVAIPASEQGPEAAGKTDPNSQVAECSDDPSKASALEDKNNASESSGPATLEQEKHGIREAGKDQVIADRSDINGDQLESEPSVVALTAEEGANASMVEAKPTELASQAALIGVSSPRMEAGSDTEASKAAEKPTASEEASSMDQLAGENELQRLASGLNGDTSGDEDQASLTVSSEDKAQALERMELALNKQADSSSSTLEPEEVSSSAEDVGDGTSSRMNEANQSADEDKHQSGGADQPQRAADITTSGSMFTNASIDSVVVIGAAPADGGAGRNEGDELAASRKFVSNQSDARPSASESSTHQDFDGSSKSSRESPATGLKQKQQQQPSNKWQTHNAESSNEPAAGLNSSNNNTAGSRLESNKINSRPVVRQVATTFAPAGNGPQAKDERRDSGVRLDSRNGLGSDHGTGQPRSLGSARVEVEQTGSGRDDDDTGRQMKQRHQLRVSAGTDSSTQTIDGARVQFDKP